jgi:thiamine biosynthesis protein ThiI
MENIALSLHGLKYRVRRERGRIFIDTSSKRVLSKLVNIPGIVSVSLATKTEAVLDKISKVAVDLAKRTLSKGQTFAIRASRAGVHNFSSREINEVVGSAVLKAVRGCRVDLSHPDRTIFVEVRGSDAYVFAERKAGVGGLPVGTQGKVVSLISRGMDGLTATYLMMKRGCSVFPIFFYDGSYRRARSQAVAMVNRLADFYPKTELRIVPFNKILEFIKTSLEFSHVLRRRVMLRIANIVAAQVKAEAVAIGESLEQIAGQTLASLMLIDDASKLPVLRPLVGMDSTEIERIASFVGEFDVPIGLITEHIAAPSCLDLEDVFRAESRIDIAAMIKLTLAKSKVIYARR